MALSPRRSIPSHRRSSLIVFAILVVALPLLPSATPIAPNPITIGFGSCLHHDYRPWTIFDVVSSSARGNRAVSNLSAFFFIGDFIYADWHSTKRFVESDLDRGFSEEGHAMHLDRLYSEGLSEDRFREFRAREGFSVGGVSDISQKNGGLHFMWDDHELKDNYDSGETGWSRFDMAKRKFKEYLQPHEHSKLYSSGVIRHSTEAPTEIVATYFLLDTRSYRSAFNMSDEPAAASAARNCEPSDLASGNACVADSLSVDDRSSIGAKPGLKTMLGSDQLSAVKKWLIDPNQSNAWKLLISSVMWNDQASRSQHLGQFYLDGWSAYRRERREIFEFIRTNNVQKVILLSADAHWCAAFYFPAWNLYEISASPMAAPNLPGPQHLIHNADVVADPLGRPFESKMLFMNDTHDGVFGLLSFKKEHDEESNYDGFSLNARIVAAAREHEPSEWKELYGLELEGQR